MHGERDCKSQCKRIVASFDTGVWPDLKKICGVLSTLIAIGLLLIAATTVAKADVTYNLVSVPFNLFYNSSCPPTCNLTGWFTVASPLAPNLVEDLGGSGSFTPITFSFTDGVTTVTNSTSEESGFNVDTDRYGNIVYFGFYAFRPYAQINAYYDGVNLTQIYVSCCAYSASYSAQYQGYAPGGVWTQAASSTPEPSSLPLLGSGLLAGLGALRKLTP